MNRFTLLLRTLASYTILCAISALIIPPCFIIACLPEQWRYDNKLFFLLSSWYFKTVTYALLLPITITGKQVYTRPVIFIANHQSSIDVPVMGALAGNHPHLWLALAYYISAPVLGIFIKRMAIPVDQSTPAKAARSLIKTLKLITNKNRHLIIFPEGGRFIDGAIHTFFEGFAIIARKTGHPIIPVYMPNNNKIYPPHSFFIHYYPLKVIIGTPVFYGAHDTDITFTNKIHTWFVERAQEEQSKN